MDEIDIWRIATSLINAHGFSGASFMANHQAKEMRRKDDAEGASVWNRVKGAIVELEKTEYERDASRN